MLHNTCSCFTDVSQKLPFVSYSELIDQAIADLDAAIALATSNEFTIDDKFINVLKKESIRNVKYKSTFALIMKFWRSFYPTVISSYICNLVNFSNFKPSCSWHGTQIMCVVFIDKSIQSTIHHYTIQYTLLAQLRIFQHVKCLCWSLGHA